MKVKVCPVAVDLGRIPGRRCPGALPAPPGAPPRWPQGERERTRWDPKDGELCLSRLKPGETLVEDRSESDVQIDRPTWV